ncbi:glutathione hydrolase 7 isoform X1 [Helicoverpa armigera]|uniref:glutathione hydrolase 7 isoform X1 n=1 Tax=Helicoverpa armigera TaxID=29058 RepID=UPI00308347DB
MPSSSRGTPDSLHASGGAETREDVPLKARHAGARCPAGPRLILAAFAALSAAITLALLTQIYYGDYELVPHGSVSSSAAACSRAGTDALKAGGRALDAAAAAALCLAVLAPHRTSLDAYAPVPLASIPPPSGALLYWEYRNARTQPAALFEWGDAPAPGARPPRLVAALATLHAQLGALPWQQLLMPTIQLAKDGFQVSEGLAAAAAAAGDASYQAGALAAAPAVAAYLSGLLANTSAELSAAWGGAAGVRRGAAQAARAGAWRALAAPRAAPALRALAHALQPPPASPDDAQRRALEWLQGEARAGTLAPRGVATGLAAVDQYDTYVALVTGTSVAFGSGPLAAAGWQRDEPPAPLDLAPAFLLDDAVCGTRYVVGAESASALAQAAAALVTDGAPGAVERARADVLPGGALALQAGRPAPARLALPAPAPPRNATPPHAAVNLVQQRADALASHADSRGGGLASRF